MSPTLTLRVLSRPLIDRPHCAGAQSRTMRLSVRALVLAAVLLTACGAPIPSPTTNGTPAQTTAPTGTPGLSPSPTHAVAPIHTPPPTPGYVPPSPATSLQVGGLARVAVELLRQVVDPDNPTAHPRQNRALDPLVNGDVVLLRNGPRSVGGREFWQVYDSSSPLPFDDRGKPLGWVPAQRDEIATLTPFQPPCPPTLPTTAAELQELQVSSRFTGLSCFGSRELVLSGEVHCDESHGDGVLGAPFFDGRRTCTLDGVYLTGRPIFDLLPDESGAPHHEIEGMYEVRGQFDHPGSQQCSWIPFGTDIGGPGPVPDPGAVASCRQFFVVTAVREL